MPKQSEPRSEAKRKLHYVESDLVSIYTVLQSA